MSMRFEHENFPQRVVFASNEAARSVATEVRRLEAQRVMVIAGKPERELADHIAADIPEALRYEDIAMHVPIEVAERARVAAESHNIDAIVSVGGGSTTGLAKAIALTSGLPIVAVPTTYAGSEATNVWGLTQGAKKTTGADMRVLPKSVVYDASLMISLPVPLSVASGLNALAHCVDSMWAPRSNPINRVFAAEGIRALNIGLPTVVADPRGVEGREFALYGAYLSAVAFASAGSGLHHKICHVLGGKYDLPHAQTHAIVLPYVLALNAPAAVDDERRMADAFVAESAVEGLERLRSRTDAPRALRDYGFEREQIPAAAEAILLVVPESNPVSVSKQDIERLLDAAWRGTEPQ